MTSYETTSQRMPTAAEQTAHTEELSTGELSIDQVDEATAREVLDRTAIHGDDWQGHILTTAELAAAALEPRWRMRYGDTEIWLSSVTYALKGDRVAVVGYVQQDTPNAKAPSYVARSYYRSNSQGVWRYLPHYMASEGSLSWYGKGWSEFSITLPSAIQQALARLSTADAPVQQVAHPERIFAGTAHNILTQQDSTYAREIPKEPQRLHGQFYRHAQPGDSVAAHVPPESMQFEQALEEPNYNQLLAEWQQYSPLYNGDITIQVYPSYDQSRRYLMCKDARGRCWVGGVEDSTSPTTSTGLHQQWIDAGDLTTPAFEYGSQAGEYGNPDITSGRYVDMFERYLRHVPIIKEYALRTAVTDATSVAQLLDRIELVGGFSGTQQQYTDQTLEEIINKVRQGELSPAYIPRQYGLRDKVKQLLAEHRYI